MKRIGLAVLSTAAALAALELVFHFVPVSHNAGITRASKVWDKYHWHPVNEYGFRDAPVPADLSERDAVFVIGDSFAAGHGIADVKDRFVDILRSRMPEGRSVVCLAQRGWTTLHEIEFLQGFPHKPKTLVLAYTFNDIEQRAAYEGRLFDGFRAYEDLPGWARDWVRASYLADYIYWLFPHVEFGAYIRFLRDCYSDPDIVSKHLIDLRYFLHYARVNDARLLVVLFPSITMPESAALMEPVKRLFTERGVEVIDAGELARGIAPARLTVSRADAHPNERFHRLVADEMFLRLEPRMAK